MTAAFGRDRHHHAVLHQVAQARRQDVLGQAEALLEFAEARRSFEGIAHDEHRPAVADHVQRAGDWTTGLLVAGALDHQGGSGGERIGFHGKTRLHAGQPQQVRRRETAHGMVRRRSG